MSADQAQAQAHARLASQLAGIARGEKAALQAIYGETAAKLFGVCLRILKDRGEAEDVLQEVYLAVWRQAGRFDPARASATTWLLAITRNRAIDRLRARSARSVQPLEADFDIAGADPSALDVLIEKGELARLENCFDEIEEKHAGAIRTAFLAGETYEEVARRFAVPLGTAKSWIRRGLAKLKNCLER